MGQAEASINAELAVVCGASGGLGRSPRTASPARSPSSAATRRSPSSHRSSPCTGRS